MPAYRADIGTVRQSQLLMNMTTLTAGLTGRKPAVNLYQLFSLPFSLIGQHFHKHAPSVIRCGFSEFQGTSDSRHIKIFERDQVISISQGCRQLMQEITPLMFGFRMQLCDFQTLCLIPLGAFLLTGKTFLFLYKCRYGFGKSGVLPLLSTYRFGRDISSPIIVFGFVLATAVFGYSIRIE